MQFPASDQEKQLVHLSACELKKHLELAAQAAAKLADMLDENFLALDNKYRMILFKDAREIDSIIWKLKLQAGKMNDHHERIISAP